MKLRNETYIITLMTAFTLFCGISQITVNANEKEISPMIMEETINSIDSFETTTTNVNSSEQIKQSKTRLKSTKLNISKNGDVKSQIRMDNNEKLELNGKFLKSDDKKTYYGEIKTNNLNYEVIHFSITRPGEQTPISKNVYTIPVLNIYIKDIISDKINFYELEIKNNTLSILDKNRENLQDASIEHVYWFTHTIDPTTSLDLIEEPSKERLVTLKTVTLNPSLTWSFNNGGDVTTIVTKFTIPTKISQSADRVITEFKISQVIITEDGVVVNLSGHKIKAIKVMLGSDTKIGYLEKVGVNGIYTTSQSPIYLNFDSSIAIKSGISIGIRPLYTSSAYSNGLMVPVDAYRLALEAKKDNSYLELSKSGHYITTTSLMKNPYVGKNFSAQYQFTLVSGVSTKVFTYNSSSMHTTLKSGTN